MASALAVEVLVSVLQHPARANAPAHTGQGEEEEQCSLGLVPHQVLHLLYVLGFYALNKLVVGARF